MHTKTYIFRPVQKNGAVNTSNPANFDDKICNTSISAPDITENVETIVLFLRKYSQNFEFSEFSLDNAANKFKTKDR